MKLHTHSTAHTTTQSFLRTNQPRCCKLPQWSSRKVTSEIKTETLQEDIVEDVCALLLV